MFTTIFDYMALFWDQFLGALYVNSFVYPYVVFCVALGIVSMMVNYSAALMTGFFSMFGKLAQFRLVSHVLGNLEHLSGVERKAGRYVRKI